MFWSSFCRALSSGGNVRGGSARVGGSGGFGGDGGGGGGGGERVGGAGGGREYVHGGATPRVLPSPPPPPLSLPTSDFAAGRDVAGGSFRKGTQPTLNRSTEPECPYELAP
jgi:hypothetical protein